MENNNGYIYIRKHKYYEKDKICKLGRTRNITDRDNCYATSEYIRGEFVMIIEILGNQEYDDKYTEKKIQNYFRKYHKKMDGGNEFYKIEIMDEIIEYLRKTRIKFRIMTKKEIEEMIYKEKIKKIRIIIKKYLQNKYSIKENRLRNKLQEIYLNEIIEQLRMKHKAFLKAPTGFGKTHIYYKIIKRMKFNRILFLTPRILLNFQLLENKYSSYIENINYNIIHFSSLCSSNKEMIIEKYSKNNDKFIMTSCYQSGNKLLEYLKKYNIHYDIIIFDEAHYISSWIDINNYKNEFLTNNKISKYKLFGSATPTEDIETNKIIYGEIIEKVRVYELINNELLCNIETIIKQLNNKKSEYHNLKDLIIESMSKYNKKKGIIYVNDSVNAQNLYNLLKSQNIINVYIFISKEINVENSNDTNIKNFENDINQSVIISIAKIGYGYDNHLIDFICLGDPRQSDIDIRQIIGRGLRWNKRLYPNKILHLLIPLYKDEFGKCCKNEHLKKYLDYIIGECGKDIIFKSNGNIIIGNEKDIYKNGYDYDGDKIPIELLNEYCTTGYNKYSYFLLFLKNNKIYDEISYNKLKETQQWMIDLDNIQKKYPKFGFRHIHPKNLYFYWNRSDAEEAYNSTCETVINKIGKDKFKRLNNNTKFNKIFELNNKIPNVNFDLYYPKDYQHIL